MAPPPFPAADVRWHWRGVGHIGARRADGAPSPDVTRGHAAQVARLRSRAVRRAIARRTALLRQHERHRISTPNAASATRPAMCDSHRSDASPSCVEIVKANRVLCHDIAAGALRQHAHCLFHFGNDTRIGAIEMRIVGSPQDIPLEPDFAHRF